MFSQLRTSTRTHLFILGAAVALPLLIFVALFLFFYSHAEYARSEELAAQFASQTTRIIDAELESNLSLLAGLAASNSFQDGEYASFYKEAKRIADRSGGVILLRSLGPTQYLNTQQEYGTALPPAIQLTEQEREGFLDGKSIISNVYRSPISGEPRYAITQSFPEKQLLLSITFQTKKLGDLLEAATPRDWITTIGDRAGNIVARSQKHEEVSGQKANPDYLEKANAASGSFRVVNFEGRRIVAGYKKSDLSGWIVGANVSEQIVSAPFFRFLSLFAVLALIALGISMLLAHAVGRVFSAATQQLSQGATNLGNQQDVEPIKTPLSDLQLVGDALSNASQAIKRRERERMLLTNELNHRVKNTLSTIQAVAHQTIRSDRSIDEMRKALTNRLVALSKAHDLLTRNNWDVASLDEIVDLVIDGYGGRDRILFSRNQAVFLRSTAALALSLTLNELATNALKYGALSVDSGHVEISASMVALKGGSLKISWREVGGPPVCHSGQSGFGTKLIRSAFSATTGASVDLGFSESGVTCIIFMPVETFIRRDQDTE